MAVNVILSNTKRCALIAKVVTDRVRRRGEQVYDLVALFVYPHKNSHKIVQIGGLTRQKSYAILMHATYYDDLVAKLKSV